MAYFARTAAILLAAGVLAAGPVARPRVAIMSDIGGTEPDDQESFVRLLLYANELDLVGLIGANSQFGPNRGDVRVFHRVIDAYAEVRPNLQQHASGYPTPAYLKSITRSGTKGKVGMAGVGDGLANEGSQLILQELAKADARPLWVLAWGGASTLAQALWDLRKAGLPQAELNRRIAKLRVYDIAGQDDSGAWIANQFPAIFYIRSGRQFMAFSERRDWRGQPSQDGDLSVANAAWHAENVQSHGSYGHQYPTAKYMFEGDTPSFLYLVPNGLGDPERPHFGSWGGRFTRDKVSPADRYLNKKDPFLPAPMYNNAADHCEYGGKSYTNVFVPLWRWRREIQNDFAARMDWTMTDEFAKANHPPVPVVEGMGGTAVVERTVAAGAVVVLSAAGSRDPDGDRLSCRWWQYREAGTFAGTVVLAGEETEEVQVAVPKEAKPGDTIHLVLSLADDGEPQLTRYRRVVLRVGE